MSTWGLACSMRKQSAVKSAAAALCNGLLAWTLLQRCPSFGHLYCASMGQGRQPVGCTGTPGGHFLVVNEASQEPSDRPQETDTSEMDNAAQTLTRSPGGCLVCFYGLVLFLCLPWQSFLRCCPPCFYKTGLVLWGKGWEWLVA